MALCFNRLYLYYSIMVFTTIIIPTFNSGKTVQVALESVLRQTFQDWECIVVDGASKDNTIEIVKEYCAKDSRFHYISERDHGIYDAFNKGWRMAKGTWIMYLGADDFYVLDGLEKLMAIASDSNDILYGDCELRFNKTRKIRGNTPLQNIGFELPACHQSMAMKRSLIEILGGFDLKYKIYGDLDIVQRAYKKGAIFTETSAIISSFYVGGVSADNLSAIKELYFLIKVNGIEKRPFLRIIVLLMRTTMLKIYHAFK